MLGVSAQRPFAILFVAATACTNPAEPRLPAWLIFACVSRWRFSSDPSVGYH